MQNVDIKYCPSWRCYSQAILKQFDIRPICQASKPLVFLISHSTIANTANILQFSRFPHGSGEDDINFEIFPQIHAHLQNPHLSAFIDIFDYI